MVLSPFLSYIFNYEVFDRREEEQRMQTTVNIYHAESAFVSFSDQFDIRPFLNIRNMCALQVELNFCYLNNTKTFHLKSRF
jgi:hypothetical protein